MPKGASKNSQGEESTERGYVGLKVVIEKN
jgi:hypothetical protein